MDSLALRTRIAVLWLFVVVTMSTNTLLYLSVPDGIDEIRAGLVVGLQAGPVPLLITAIMYYWVPLIMAILSLTLKDEVNRWATSS
jgi:hypothetical protein